MDRTATNNSAFTSAPLLAGNPPTIRAAALINRRTLASSVTLPMEIMQAAAQIMSSEQAGSTRRGQKRPSAEFSLLSTEGGPIALDSGMTLDTQPLSDTQTLDLLLIPAIWRHPRWVIEQHPEHIAFIRRAVSQGTTICSVGSGSFLVAETDLMASAVATTHWHWFDEFERRYPNVILRRDQLITQSSGIYCVGSVNSIADLWVYFCSQWFTPSVALAVENQFSPEIRRRFSPNDFNNGSQTHSDELVMDMQFTLGANLREAPSISVLAERYDLAVRTLNRRFLAATNLTPTQYLQQLRLKEARALLHQSNLAIAEVAWTIGINDSSRFAEKFRQAYGVTPREFRSAVRGKSFTLEQPKAVIM